MYSLHDAHFTAHVYLFIAWKIWDLPWNRACFVLFDIRVSAVQGDCAFWKCLQPLACFEQIKSWNWPAEWGWRPLRGWGRWWCRCPRWCRCLGGCGGHSSPARSWPASGTPGTRALGHEAADCHRQIQKNQDLAHLHAHILKLQVNENLCSVSHFLYKIMHVHNVRCMQMLS